MKPSMETIHDPTATLTKLGAGMYATVYRQEDGTVLKISKGLDGSMDYIEWCFLRLKKYGKGSVEMMHFPEVEHFGKCKLQKKNLFSGQLEEVDGWWCVMPEYVEAYQSPPCKANNGRLDAYNDRGNYCGYIYKKDIERTEAFIKRLFGWDFLDVHSGNVMWDESRNSWVITDPSADDSTGSAAKMSQDTRFAQRKKLAAWKRSPLQCLYQRH